VVISATVLILSFFGAILAEIIIGIGLLITGIQMIFTGIRGRYAQTPNSDIVR
jgi:hypothetical protein